MAMHTPYAKPVTIAYPDVGLREPSISPWALGMARSILGAYLRLALGFERVELRGGDELARAFAGALSGERRLILAFRHPYGDEPQLLSWAFLRGVEREASRAGVRLPARPHAVFVHGYEVPRWGGALIRWLLPRVGAMPVHHSKMDSAGMARIRAAIEDGPYPLALSPEGQVSYTADGVPRLEPGAARLGLQAADRLARAGRAARVELMPVSVRYRYGPRARRSLLRLLARLEAFVGVRNGSAGEPVVGRLGRCLEAVLAEAERQYGLEPADAAGGADGAEGGVAARAGAVVEAALDAGERILGIGRGAGDQIERLYRIRQIGWDRVFLPPEEDPRGVSGLRRAVLDRRAGEAWYAMRHMELADFAWYLRSGPPAADGGATTGPLVEFAQNLWDFANRLAGGAISGRREVRPKRAVVVASPPIDLSARLEDYRRDRKAAQAAVTDELARSYKACIKEFIDEERG